MTTSRPWRSSNDPVPYDILEALDSLGVAVVRCTQNEAWALCPGHEARLGRPNRSPTKWSVNLDTGLHSCFSCGFSGSFVTLVQEILDYDKFDAVQWVYDFGGVRRIRRDLEPSSECLSADEGPRWSEARLALFTGPPDSARLQRRVSSGSVEKYGVLWDSKNENWILPIRDPYTGSLWGYQEKSDGWVSNKPNGVLKASTFFGIDCFEGTTAVLLESPLDCLRLYTAGISGGLSSFGVNVSDVQLELLLDISDTVVFAFDNDTAGISQSLAMRKRFLKRGRDIRFFNYSHIPSAKDIGSFGVSDEDIRYGLESARSLVLYR